MDKRRLHHLWTKIRPIKPWYVFTLFLISGVVCVLALRANNIRMIELREAVYQADKQNGDVEAALQRLRAYVYAHMNTNLASGPNAVHPPIQLKYTYDRLTAAQQRGDNSHVYNDAQKYCEKRIPSQAGISGRYRLSCIKDYVNKHKAAAPEHIPKNLYQFDFVSPSWSPDLAGWSFVVSLLLFAAFLVILVFHRFIRHKLHEHK